MAINIMQQTARDNCRLMKAMGCGKMDDEMKRVVHLSGRTSRSARSSPRDSPGKNSACQDLSSRDLWHILLPKGLRLKIRCCYHRSSSHLTLVKSMGLALMIKARAPLLLAKSPRRIAWYLILSVCHWRWSLILPPLRSRHTWGMRDESWCLPTNAWIGGPSKVRGRGKYSSTRNHSFGIWKTPRLRWRFCVMFLLLEDQPDSFHMIVGSYREQELVRLGQT